MSPTFPDARLRLIELATPRDGLTVRLRGVRRPVTVLARAIAETTARSGDRVRTRSPNTSRPRQRAGVTSPLRATTSSPGPVSTNDPELAPERSIMDRCRLFNDPSSPGAAAGIDKEVPR